MILSIAIAALCLPGEHSLLAVYRDGGVELSNSEKAALARGANEAAIADLKAEGYTIVQADGWLKVAISPQCPPFNSFAVKNALGSGLVLNRPVRWGDLAPASQTALLPAIQRGPATVSKPDPNTRIMLTAEVLVDFVIAGKPHIDAMALHSEEKHDLYRSSTILKAHPLKEDRAQNRPSTQKIEVRIDAESERSPVLPELLALASRTYADAVDEQAKQADIARNRVLQQLLSANPDLQAIPGRGADGSDLPGEWKTRMKDTFVNSASVLGFKSETAAADWESGKSTVRSIEVKVHFAVQGESGEPFMVAAVVTSLN